MVLESSLFAAFEESIPTLVFDDSCPIEIQMLFTALLGGAVGVVLAYIISELNRYFFKE